MIKKLTQNAVPGSQGFTVDHPVSSAEEAAVSSAAPKGIHMNQGNLGVVENKEAAQSRNGQLAENKMQADARAAELNAQLDQPVSDDKKPKENNIIAILIG